MSVNEAMTAVADKIRSYTGDEAKMTLYEIPTNIDNVHEKGYSSGYEVGYDSGREFGFSEADSAWGKIADNTAVTLDSNASINGLRAFAFYQCTNLEDVSFPNSTGTIGGYAFSGCSALQNVNLPNADGSVGAQAFANCQNLKYISLPKVTYTNGDPFLNSGVEIVDFGVCQVLFSQMFQGCTALKSLVLRRNDVCILSQSNAFDNTNIASGTAYIYVPSSLVDSYKVETNWSNYASQIRAIEDYPDITGG